MNKKISARNRIRRFFEENLGKIVTTQQIEKIAGISDYQRRIRELRNEEGYQIKSYKDRLDLKPNQYILETLKRLPKVDRKISRKLRNEIFERNGFTCRLCGKAAGDPDETNPGRKVQLHIDHEVPLAQGGTNSRENLRVLCSLCNQEKSNLQLASETAINLLARIRKTSRQVQKEVFEALKRSLGEK